MVSIAQDFMLLNIQQVFEGKDSNFNSLGNDFSLFVFKVPHYIGKNVLKSDFKGGTLRHDKQHL